MYNTSMLTKGLSLSKIIGGLSKTLQIANQVIPLYQKAKPIIKNARSAFSVLQELKKTIPQKEEIKEANYKVIAKTEETSIKKEGTTPTFFL